MTDRFEDLNDAIIGCAACPRLCEWCQGIAVQKRKAYRNDGYWGRPVPNFGDPSASRLIVGLAPAAHGANRTGRMFTGDRSGDWLYRGLHRAGLANQGTSEQRSDGLELSGVVITAVCHCAPPDNKPTPREIENCRTWFSATLRLRSWKVILCLGQLAWTETHKAHGLKVPKFGHGVETDGVPAILASFHPSQQNTFTGRLTEPMFDAVLARFRELGG